MAARAQQAERVRRIGVLMSSSEADPEIQARMAALRQGLARFGWAEGRNIQFTYYFTAGSAEQAASFAKELVALKPDLIVATATSLAAALQRETRVIPIVFTGVVDPVRSGLIASLARPGGNLTGINFVSTELVAKQLELLRELVPGAARVTVMVNPADATNTETILRDVEPAVRAIGWQIQVLKADTSQAIDAAFAAFVRQRPDALFVGSSPFFTARRVQLVQLTAYHRVPATYVGRQYTEIGGLMSYGASLTDAFRQMGVYTGRILKGAKPADLPVVQASKFELVINHQTARMLGLTVPDKLLAAADEVIE